MRKADLRRSRVPIRTAAALAAGLAALWAGADAQVSPRLKPAARGLEYSTPGDLERLKEIKKAIDKRDWASAKALAAGLSSPVAQSMGRWRYFYAEDPLVRIEEADAFLDSHPGWPALAKIQTHVERRIPNTASAKSVLDFFETRDPLTGEGMIQLIRAEFAAGRPDAGAAYAQEAWKRFNFAAEDEQRFVTLYGRYLSPDDHIARVDRLLWSREATAARRVFARLPARERRMAEARAALILGAENGPTLFNSLPDDERLDSGVLLAAVRHYRRRDEEPRAIALAMQAPADPVALRNSVRWWEERQLLMRWALEERRYADAYAMAAGHGLDPGMEFSEAEFNAGWIALRFMNSPERAETHFAALAGTVGAPISLSRAFYWLGRSAEAKGDETLARTRYADAARYIYTFYGQLAAERLGAPATAQTFAEPIAPTPEDKAAFSSRPLAHALRLLSELGDGDAFLVFAYHLDDQLETPGEYVELARLADRIGATHVTVRAGKVGVGRGAFAAEVVYPLIHIPDQARRYAPAEIILGLSRQESEFNPRAYSRAGARGMMQLLPTTAQITAKKEGLAYSRSRLLEDPEYNLVIGAAHLSHLFARFNSSRIMTFVAYNAGPNRVGQWIETFGDPRSPSVDPVDWVELIPFAETRNYVQRVLENTQVYRSRLDGTPIAGMLASDMELGGGSNRAGRLPGRQFAGTMPPLPDRTKKYAEAAKAGVLAPPAPEPAPASVGPQPAPQATATSLGMSAASNEFAGKDSADFIGDAPGQALRRQIPVPRLEPTRLKPPAPPPVAPNSLQTPNAEPLSPAISGAAAPRPIALPSGETPVTPNAQCSTYRDYVASTEGENAQAADLNAGMLAELQGGGGSCATERIGEPAARM
jgi:soluble lytic murein transglycosylase